MTTFRAQRTDGHDTSMKNIHRINGLIYITSEEDIKTGYYLDLNYKIVMKSVFYTSCNKNCKKIILTNDPALTSDGIQAIDPDAVKWLNDNPSCELVDVNNLPKQKELLNIRCIHSHEDGITKGKTYKAIKQDDWGFDILCDDHGNKSGWDKRYFEVDSTHQTIEEAAETYTEQQVFNLILLSSNMQFKSIQEVKDWLTENIQQC